MLTIARRTVALWWQAWPWLIAIYLVGWFVRYWVLQFAISIGLEHGQLWGSVLMAVVPIVRLLTYLGMFLLIRSLTPGLQHVDTEGGTSPHGLIDVTLTAILPFLVIYTAWKLVVEDYFVDYTTVNLTTVYEGSQDRVAAVVNNTLGASLWIVMIIAFLLRQSITRLRNRLPRWTMFAGVYLEVLWIFLAIQASSAAMFGTQEWIDRRRFVVWYRGIRDEITANFGLLGTWWDFIGSGLGLLFQVLALSLAWLAIASAVYGTPLTDPHLAGRQADVPRTPWRHRRHPGDRTR